MSPETLDDADGETEYTLEGVAGITGISTRTILLYQEYGLIPQSGYDDEAIRTLRRIEHLRRTCEANLAGVRMILELVEEVELLRTALRARR